MTAADENEAADRLRIDLWIWRARFARSRPLAQELVEKGRVRVNRDKVKTPGRRVGIGDVITIAAHRQVRVVRILALPDRRGSPPVARTLYEDLSPPGSDADDDGEA